MNRYLFPSWHQSRVFCSACGGDAEHLKCFNSSLRKGEHHYFDMWMNVKLTIQYVGSNGKLFWRDKNESI